MDLQRPGLARRPASGPVHSPGAFGRRGEQPPALADGLRAQGAYRPLAIDQWQRGQGGLHGGSFGCELSIPPVFRVRTEEGRARLWQLERTPADEPARPSTLAM